jgi:hypothetical protein
MNQQQLQARAMELDQLLARLAPGDAEAADLHSALRPLLAQALAGTLGMPLAWGDIPGARLFTEGRLRRLAELEQAYARFRIEASGGESPALRKLRGDMESS